MKRLTKFTKFIDRPWFYPLLLIIVAADCFFILIPADPIMFSIIWVRAKQWIPLALFFAFATAVGAASFDFAFTHLGLQILELKVKGIISPDAFAKTQAFFDHYGTWALAGAAFGPFPIQPLILIASIAHVSVGAMFVSIFLGRFGKNLILCGIGSYAPETFKKIISEKSTRQKKG
ncbi:MAG: hypothetical protein KA715_14030 [Xanthomonadaceae bacterium]|nr:hypothetical protein [Xanthomonadaceae bacterium]